MINPYFLCLYLKKGIYAAIFPLFLIFICLIWNLLKKSLGWAQNLGSVKLPQYIFFCLIASVKCLVSLHSLSASEKKRSRTPSPRPVSLRDAGTQTPPSSRSSPSSIKSRSSSSRGSHSPPSDLRSPVSDHKSPVDEIRSLIEDLKVKKLT